MSEWFESAQEAADTIGVTAMTINRWISAGTLPAQRGLSPESGGREVWRIRREDLAERIKGTRYSFKTDLQQGSLLLEQVFQDPDAATRDHTSLRVRWPAEERVEPFRLDLFLGYSRFRALTYSVSADMIFHLLTTCHFDQWQIVFGSDKLVNAKMSEVMAAQVMVRAAMTDAYFGIGGDLDRRAVTLLGQIAEGKGEFRSLKDKVAHSKIYLLDGQGKTRVIVGSANLSETAFSGRQAEIMVAYDNHEWMYRQVERDFLNLYQVGTVDAPLVREQIHPAELDDVDVGEFLFPTEMAQQKPVAIYVPATQEDDPDKVRKLGVVQETAENRLRIAAAGQLKPTKDGYVNLTPAKYQGIVRRAAEAAPERQRVPTPNLTYQDGQFIYNGRTHERPTLAEDVQQISRDAVHLIQYLENYAQFGSGAETLQRGYFAIMSWLYFAPFMPRLKKAKEDQGPGDFGGKLVAILYGDPNCGKTDLVRLLLTSMFGSAKYYGDADFTQAQVRGRSQEAGLFPLFYDDVGADRISGHKATGVKIIKEMDQEWKGGDEYPCIIASLNSDTSELVGEAHKRTLKVYTDCGLPLWDLKKTDQLRKESQMIHNRIGTSFYREYLYRMDQMLPTDGAALAELDYLALSSRLIMETLAENLEPGESLPDWFSVVPALDFDSVYWDGKRDVIEDTYLSKSVQVDVFPPPHNHWTYHQDSYVLGVDAFQRRNVIKDFPPECVDRRRSRGEVIFLKARQMDIFMREDGRNWRPPARGSWAWWKKAIGKLKS